MKRIRLFPTLKKSLLAVPAAAMMLGASHGAQIGINFQDNYAGNAYAPLTDAAGAFGIPLANWFNAPMVFNSSGGAGVGTNGVFAVPGGGNLGVSWASKNTWSLYAAIPGTGDNQVIYGYLDDSDYGYTVRLTGLRAFASSFTITAIAATDGGVGFMPVNVFSATDTNTLEYLNNFVPDFTGNASPLAGTSTVSTAFITLNGNDAVMIRGLLKTNSEIRSCLAGIIIDYTPAADNPPLIEVNPQPPTSDIFPGDSFALVSLASGGPPLHYQWRLDGNEISGANFASYTNTSASVGDTGTYDVVVTNISGSVTSTVAQVTIQNVVAPAITQPPLSQNLYAGYPVTFTVAATGGQLAYQWKSNGVAIAGATGTTYSLASITAADAATYSVDVSNPVGPTASASATLAVMAPAPGTYEAAVAQTKPLLWFRYSDTSAQLQDSATNSGSLGAAGLGLYVGSAAHPVAGALIASSDTAANFSGGKVTVPYNAAINPIGSFSVDCWMNPVDVGVATRVLVQSMVNGENPGNANDRSGWSLRQSGADLQFLVGSDTGAPFYYYYTVAGAVTAGTWQHVAVTYDGTAPSIYTNGVLAAVTVTRQDGLPITPQEIADIRILPNTAAPLIVGDRGYGGWTFNGSLDEVAIYGSALSASAVLAHYLNGVSPTPTPAYNTLVINDGAVEYLRLDEPALGSGTPANVGTLGAAWNGTYTDAGGVLGSPQIQVGQPGPLPPTYPGFESTNRSLSVTNGYATAPQLPLNTNTVTITCWMNRADTFTTGDLGWPAWLGGGGMHLNLTTSSSPGELRYHWNGNNWDWASGLFVPANVWTFCALVIEPTKATMYMSDGTTLLSSVDNSAHLPMIVTSPPGFGGNQPGNPTRNFIGQLDETAVYDRALTQSEITTLFLVGSGAPFTVDIVPGGIIADTKPVGTPDNGANYLTTWLASSADPASVTRTGVEVFATTNNSQITVPANADFDSTTGTFTFWMKADAPIPEPGNEGAIIFDRRTTSGAVIVLNDAGNIFVQCSGGANSLAVGYLPDGLWHNVAVTYDQSASGVVSIYVDGVLTGSSPNTAAWSWPVGQQVELGRSHDSYWKRYDGQLDDFRIYNRVLTDPEIADVASSGALVDTAALKLRFNFDTSGIGQSVTWPFGTLLSSPTLDPGAIWTPVPGATPPTYPFLPTDAAKFFRATP